MYIVLYWGNDLIIIYNFSSITPLCSLVLSEDLPQTMNSSVHPAKAKDIPAGAPGSQFPGHVALITSPITLETVDFSVCT